MKKLIGLILFVMILLSSIVIAQSAITTLKKGENKVYEFGPKSYNIILTELTYEKAKFKIGDEESNLIGISEEYVFSNNVAISVAEIIKSIDPTTKTRVKFAINIPTEDCGATRCYPGERCSDIRYCYQPGNCVSKKGCETYCGNDICDLGEMNICAEDCSFCGNKKCESNEICSTCREDCTCDPGYVCDVDTCKKKQEVVEPIQEEPKPSFFQSILNWLERFFLK